MLLGVRSQSLVSLLESAGKRPSAKVLAACELVFDAPIRDLFPALHTKVKASVLRNAQRLASRGRTGRHADHLRALIIRLSNAP
jgi:transcriptional regulator with XRE-family HTH domain